MGPRLTSRLFRKYLPSEKLRKTFIWHQQAPVSLALWACSFAPRDPLKTPLMTSKL